jgi:peptidoglycan-associated lipoprotein
MTKKFWICLALLLVIPGLMLTTSCAKRVPCGPEVTPMEVAEAPTPPAEEAPAAVAPAPAPETSLIEDVYFEFDKSTLVPEAQEILRNNAKWLMANPDAAVIIEGHCDERGTNEYNMALGDRRAGSAKSFLVDLGVAEQRLTTISFGEEKPADPGHNEEAWAKNRRAHFVVD